MVLKKWTITRRGVQVAVIALIASPLFGLTFFQGNLSAGTLFGISLSDPLAFLQATLAGPIFTVPFLISTLIVTIVYFLLGGRTFCGWICPVNLITELGDKLRRRLHTGEQLYPLTGVRWSFVTTLVISLLSGIPLFEVLSPIGITTRAIMFHTLLPLLFVAAIIVIEVGIARRLWCRSLCPAGGFYSLLGRFSPVRISFNKEACSNCGECTRVCPAEEVLVPCLIDACCQVTSGDCTRCGECIDVCIPKALGIGTGYK